jgi:hypothetical protein
VPQWRCANQTNAEFAEKIYFRALPFKRTYGLQRPKLASSAAAIYTFILFSRNLAHSDSNFSRNPNSRTFEYSNRKGRSVHHLSWCCCIVAKRDVWRFAPRAHANPRTRTGGNLEWHVSSAISAGRRLVIMLHDDAQQKVVWHIDHALSPLWHHSARDDRKTRKVAANIRA